MIVVISPSKSVMKQQQPNGLKMTSPLFTKEKNRLVELLQSQSKAQLQKLLQVSPAIAELNYERFQSWDNTAKRAALWMYSGDVYNGLDAYSLSPKQQSYAQSKLVIISGLYGVLQPLDTVQPYRLEMKLPIVLNNTTNLYDYWYSAIKSYLDSVKAKTILLCASKEYAKAIHNALPESTRTITPRFMQETPEGLKEKGLFAKYARGALARYVIENEITDPKKLKEYKVDGFTFSEDLSSDNEYVYIIPANFTLKGRFIKR